MVANDVSADGVGFDHDTNAVTILGRDGSRRGGGPVVQAAGGRRRARRRRRAPSIRWPSAPGPGVPGVGADPR